MLEDVSFTVQAGEFITLVGPSGCGKTTLLDLIAGLAKPDRGQILVDGQAIEGPGLDRGIVFQQYALFPWKTVLGNITFGLRGGTCRGPTTAPGPSIISAWSGSTVSPAPIRMSSPAGWRNASALPARWRCRRTRC